MFSEYLKMGFGLNHDKWLKKIVYTISEDQLEKGTSQEKIVIKRNARTTNYSNTVQGPIMEKADLP